MWEKNQLPKSNMSKLTNVQQGSTTVVRTEIIKITSSLAAELFTPNASTLMILCSFIADDNVYCLIPVSWNMQLSHGPSH